MEEDLVAHLLADPDLAALVGERITWNLRPQGGELPAVVLQLVTGRPDQLLDGPGRLSDNVVQVDCWGATFAQAKTTARAAEAALGRLPHPFQGPGRVESRRDDAFTDQAPAAGGGPSELHRSSLDVRAWRHEP